jgi:hypothetical protein
MAENPRPPVAIRIVRPFQTEEEFLDNELETVGKTSVILIGAHPRPTGVILRFEVTLASGATVLRGEGRVLAHKESAFRGQPGLSLRFTRLDPKSKALVDRAAVLREQRLAATSGTEPPPPQPEKRLSRPPPPSKFASQRPSPIAQRSDPVIAAALTAETPEPAPVVAPKPPPLPSHLDEAPTYIETRSDPPGRGIPFDLTPPPAPVAHAAPPPPSDREVDPALLDATVEVASLVVPPINTAPAPPPQLTVAPDLMRTPEPAPVSPIPAPVAAAPKPRVDAEGHARKVDPPPNRDELLSRLRQRASELDKDRVDAILASRH